MEVQNHGVVFEDHIVKSITGIGKDEYQKLIKNAYTASMDITKGTKSDRDYSIKVSKNGKGIGCADILRFIRHCREGEFTMIVGCWKQTNPTTKTFYEILEFNITPEDYTKIWANINTDVLTPYVEYIRSIPNGKEGQMANQKLWKQKREEIYLTFGKGIANIDVKVDSKSQRRIQCSLKAKDLIDSGISYTRHTSNYKDIKLPYEQESSPRQFTKS